MNMPLPSTVGTPVTWFVDGIAHDRVQWFSNVEPKVVCGERCCCKSTDPATYHQSHKDDPDEWGDPEPKENNPNA